MIPIVINGDTYKSISAAWRARSPDGLPMITVRKRLKAGWETGPAFLQEPVAPIDRRTFPLVRSGDNY